MAKKKSDLTSMIAEAAYFRAERRNFEPGYELQDWLEAEQAVTVSLKSAKRLIATPTPIEAPATATQHKRAVKKTGTTKATAKRTTQTAPATDPS